MAGFGRAAGDASTPNDVPSHATIARAGEAASIADACGQRAPVRDGGGRAGDPEPRDGFWQAAQEVRGRSQLQALFDRQMARMINVSSLTYDGDRSNPEGTCAVHTLGA